MKVQTDVEKYLNNLGALGKSHVWLLVIHSVISLFQLTREMFYTFAQIPATPVSHKVMDSSFEKFLVALVGLKFQSIEQGLY